MVTEQLSTMGLFTSKMMVWWMVVFFVLVLAYLLWIRRYFRAGSALPAGEDRV